MPTPKILSALCFVALAGCGIPPLDTTYVSNVPADARSFAVAQQAAKACTETINKEKVLKNFRKAGFKVSIQTVKTDRHKTIERYVITPPHEAVTVFYHGGRCVIGLENMTPSQSAQLAQIWVKAHDAKPNSEFGDGLSDHVSGAWRHFFTEPYRLPDKAAYRHRIYIASYKTWPQDPYHPQRNAPFPIGKLFPDVPGAAIRIHHAYTCNGHVKTGPRSGVFLPCTGPEYKPR